MEGKGGGLVLWDASRIRKRPTSTAAPVPGAVEHGTVQEVGDAIGKPGGGTEQAGGRQARKALRPGAPAQHLVTVTHCLLRLRRTFSAGA